MDIIGVIAEYNPFHTGHKYHIDKIKELYPDSVIIAVISSSFTQRGDISIMNKWDKTKIALLNGIDLVVELPFVFSSQSADVFARGAIKILHELKVEKIVFGSESNDLNLLFSIASIQVNNPKFDLKVKHYLDAGFNYPTSLAKAISDFSLKKIDSPNDLLGISYIKEIIKNNYNMEAITIKRTNNYHGNNNGEILSASEIRNKLNNKSDVDRYLTYNSDILYKNISSREFLFLKYKILADINILKDYQTVDEGIEGRIKKLIDSCDNMNDLVTNIKNKRYTYNRIRRMLTHILTSFTKEEALYDANYIRILGFNSIGKKYLNNIKKELKVPLITNYKSNISNSLDLEYRITKIYSLIVNDTFLIKRELLGPIKIDK